MTERALVPPEGGEDDAALVRLVVVVEQVAGHESRVPGNGHHDIRASP
jgi:hypothetical protein